MASNASDRQALDRLKNLLLKPEQQQIRRIEKRLEDPMVRAEEVSGILPDAISLSVMQSDKLPRVIQPVIDDALKASVHNNPKAIADAIFPALGPGIRKAITSTIMGMIQSLNQVLNHSFSVQGLKWRFEALKTGKPFAEVVLLHTLVFQVEQLFLIHKETGIVLEHVVAKDAIIQDPDLVSAMLTAIQDFVTDSFGNGTEENLETLRIGADRTVWIEKGEHALIAAVLRGTPPLELRTQYRRLLEEIHIKSAGILDRFNGDPSGFSIFRESLKDGLISKAKTEQKKISPLLWIVFFIILFFLAFSGWQAYQTHRDWQDYLDEFKSRKGLVLLSVDRKGKTGYIRGLRDPLYREPDQLPGNLLKKGFQVFTTWQPFYSLDPEVVILRARETLAPPATISLSLSGRTLQASGKATQQWIDRFRRLSCTLPGIEGYDDSLVQNIDQAILATAAKELSEIRIYFENNQTLMIPGQEDLLKQALEKIKQIHDFQLTAKTPVQIVILGHTDSTGTEKRNLRLSRNRAEKIFNYFLVNGATPAFLTFSGIGTQLPLVREDSVKSRQFNRAVSFKTFQLHPNKGQ